MLAKPQPPWIHLPKAWQNCVKSAVLHAIALAHYTIVYTRAWGTDSIHAWEQLDAAPSTHVVTANRPNHVWHVDLTAVPTYMGFWAPWLPFALPQCRPLFCWMAVVIDHYSRRVMCIETFRNNPTAVSVSHFLKCAIHTAKATPEYTICYKGQQFWCGVLKHWCDHHGITPRFGAVASMEVSHSLNDSS